MMNLVNVILKSPILLTTEITEIEVDDILTKKSDNPLLEGLENAGLGFLNESIGLTERAGILLIILFFMFFILSTILFKNKKMEFKEGLFIFVALALLFFAAVPFIKLLVEAGRKLFNNVDTSTTVANAAMCMYPKIMQLINLIH